MGLTLGLEKEEEDEEDEEDEKGRKVYREEEAIKGTFFGP